MQDRVPTYPGRVKLIPVQGQENTYDMERADQPTQVGTPLNKASLLKDSTAALFGLGTDAVPDDVFTFLGKYNQYWWKRRRVTPIENRTKVDFIFEGGSTASYYPVEYSSDVSVDISSGLVALKEPVQTLSLSYEEYTDATRLRNKYFHPYLDKKSGKIYYCDSNAQFSQGSSLRIEATNAYEITYSLDTEAWEYLLSTDREAYPDRGESGGYEYQFLGIPFDNAVETPKIATGSYVGTGTAGSGNRNTLTFAFEPKLVIIHGQTQRASNPAYDYGYTIMVRPATRYETIVTDAFGAYTGSIVWDDNEVYWYSSGDAGLQFNQSGQQYEYFAIG